MRFAHAAVLNQAEALSLEILESSVPRPSRSTISACVTPSSSKRFFHQPRVSSSVTRNPVREMLCVPRFSGVTRQSKKVMSLPGVAFPSA
jgi:hypothetical protein